MSTLAHSNGDGRVETKLAHYLLFSYSAWGHTRPMLLLTLTLLLRHPHLSLTLLVYEPLLPLVNKELAKWSLTSSDEARLNIIGFDGDKDSGDQKSDSVVRRGKVKQVGELAVQTYADYYAAHVLNPSTATAPTGDRPSAIILDASIAPAFLARKAALDRSAFGEAVREEEDGRVKVLTFHPASSSYVGFTFFKDSVLPPLVAKGVADLEAERKTSVKEVWDEISLTNPSLVPVVGQEPMFMFETEPSSHLPLDPWLRTMHSLQLLHASSPSAVDGLVVVWPYEELVQRASEGTFPGGRFYQVGPLLAPSPRTDSVDEDSDREGVIRWLDGCVKEGEVVVYISFGSIFFPPSFSHLKILISTLLSSRTKFILVAGAADPATLALLHSLLGKKGGHGERYWFETGWVDQLAVLRHEKTGWFLTHGGSGGVMEGVMCGVPMIFYPATFDQPLIASQLSHPAATAVGVELLQVRQNGNVGEELARGVKVAGTDEAVREEMEGVWRFVRSEEGEEMRVRVQEMGERWKRGVRERGEGGFEALERLGGL